LAEKKRSRSLAVVVLAAGKGTRLKSATPKVLHPICGRPALWHAIDAARAARPTKIVVVLGHAGDEVRAAVESWKLTPKPVFVEQGDPLGTGHAVTAAEAAVEAGSTRRRSSVGFTHSSSTRITISERIGTATKRPTKPKSSPTTMTPIATPRMVRPATTSRPTTATVR
jgi:bifunctional UDP-N-acetylglucosamine pyrophosphorylase/glucosamine-1-phosphate N-acetyltransferase